MVTKAQPENVEKARALLASGVPLREAAKQVRLDPKTWRELRRSVRRVKRAA